MQFEIERQAAVLDAGGRVIQETRHFHEDTGTTTSGRSKEEAQDYRYFPEPDLVPVAPPRDWVEQIRAALPEPPAARRARLRAEWNLSETDMTALSTPARSTWWPTDGRGRRLPGRRPQVVAGRALPARPRHRHRAGARSRSRPAQVARVTELVAAGTLNDKLARQVIDAVLAGEGDPDEVVEARGLAVVSDESALTKAVDEAIAANPEVAAKIRDGKTGRGRRPGRRGHEGHPRPGRRRPRPRADPGAPHLAGQRRAAPGAGAGGQRAAELP